MGSFDDIDLDISMESITDDQIEMFRKSLVTMEDKHYEPALVRKAVGYMVFP